MPWKAKKLLLMMVFGFAALTLAVVVLVRDHSLDTNLLAYLGLAGGAAIILNALPDNGNGQTDDRP